METKFKLFLNPIEGREKYLNNMSAQGYQLVKSGSILQRFQKKVDSKRHYTVQYIGHMTNRERHSYCNFLQGMGYQTYFAPLNIGKVSFGNIRLRPYNQGRAVLATNPGMINQEILIIETPSSKAIPAFSDKSDKKADLKRRLRPAIYLLLISLLMLLIGIFQHFDISQSAWSWAIWSYRPFERTPWAWFGLGSVLFVYAVWCIAKIRSLINHLD